MFRWLNGKSDAQFLVLLFGALVLAALIVGTVITVHDNDVKNQRANNCAAYGGETYGQDNWLCVR